MEDSGSQSWLTSESPGGLGKTDCRTSILFLTVGLWWGLRICVSNKFPVDADADYPGTAL